ncbi:MAG: hypothetical protein ABIP69_05220 [Ferruginibacter sp.]
MKRHLPSPITILIFVIILGAIATWLIPAGKYSTLSYEAEHSSFIVNTEALQQTIPFNQKSLYSLNILIPLAKFSNGDIRKPVSIPGTYKKLKQNRQSFFEVIKAPIKGIYDSADIIFFLLFIGSFMHLFHASGALEKGLSVLSTKMNGKETWLIIILTFLFSFGGASFGMAEEGLVFYAVITPLFIKAGYDLLVPVAVIFGGTQLGTLSSFTNPFSTIIASNAAGVNWTDGLNGRLLIFVITTAITIWYIVRYAQKVKADPTKSLVYKIDGNVKPEFDVESVNANSKLDNKSSILITLFISTFLIMIVGVVYLDWWLPEMTALFLTSSLITGFILKLNERRFVKLFVEGAQSMLSVAFIVGVARGVSVILNEGNIADSIIYYSSKQAGSLPPVLFILLMLVLFIIFTLFISSSSGMAVLTMPIMGGLATMVNVPGREIVNAYLFGMGIMGFLTPTGLILPSLALVNVSLKTWFKFIYPLIIILFIVCAICLVVGLYI